MIYQPIATPKQWDCTSDCIHANHRLQSIVAMNKETNVVLEIMRPERIKMVYDICEDGREVARFQEQVVV